MILDMSQGRSIRICVFSRNEHTWYAYEGKSGDIVERVSESLERASLQSSDVEGIAVVMGEGTFTGTRLATTVANTFSFVGNVPLISIVKADIEKPEALVDRFSDEHNSTYISATYSGAPNIR